MKYGTTFSFCWSGGSKLLLYHYSHVEVKFIKCFFKMSSFSRSAQVSCLLWLTVILVKCHKYTNVTLSADASVMESVIFLLNLCVKERMCIMSALMCMDLFNYHLKLDLL